jgi:hypothetical protein
MILSQKNSLCNENKAVLGYFDYILIIIAQNFRCFCITYEQNFKNAGHLP